MKLKENKGMSLIVFTLILAVLLVVAVGIIVYLLDNLKMVEKTPAIENEIVSNEQISKEFFEEYLEVFEYLGKDFSKDKDEDLNDFIVFSYIGKDGKEIENSHYNEYIEIPTQEIENLIYKYFGNADYKVKDNTGKFYKIEVNGEKTRIYTVGIGLERYDMKIQEIKSIDKDNLTITAKFTFDDYDPSDEYTMKFDMKKYEDGYYRIQKIISVEY